MARAIDADAFREWWLENGENEYVYDTNAFLDSIDNWPTLTPQNEWISVRERLPEPKFPSQQRGFYLVALSNGVVKELEYEFRAYENMLFDVGWHETAYPVTHWMPLPAPPGEGNNVPNEAPNDPLTLEDAKKERYIWFTPLNDWAKVTPFGVLFFGSEELMNWETLCEEWGYRFKAYRRPPEVSP